MREEEDGWIVGGRVGIGERDWLGGHTAVMPCCPYQFQCAEYTSLTAGNVITIEGGNPAAMRLLEANKNISMVALHKTEQFR